MTLSFDARKYARIAAVLGVVAIVVNAAFYVVVIRPRVRAAIDLDAGRVDFERELAMAEKQHKALQTYYDKLTTSQQNTEKFFTEILGTKQTKMIGIQQEISRVADEFGIDPQSVSMTNDDKQDDGLERFGIEIPIEGDYANLRKFLARLESSVLPRRGQRSTPAGRKKGLQLQLIDQRQHHFRRPWLKTPKAPQGGKAGRAS
jgi:hypothetical protein